MNSKPFLAEGCNISNEIIYTTRPATFGNAQLTIEQTHKRTIMDSDNSVVFANHGPGGYITQPPRGILKHSTANPPSYLPFQPTNVTFSDCSYNKPSYITPQQQRVPGGVVYRFNEHCNCPYPGSNQSQFGDNMLVFNNGTPFKGNVNVYQEPMYPNTCNCQQQQHPQMNTLQEHIAFRNMGRQNTDNMLLQQHIQSNPFELKFHYNGQTDTLDLLGGRSRGTPDFRNISGMMTQTYGADLIEEPKAKIGVCCSSNIRRLNLTTSPDLQTRNLRLSFEPLPEEMEGSQSQKTNEIQKSDDQLMSEIIEENIEQSLNEHENGKTRKTENKDVNTDSTNMLDKGSETSGVHFKNSKRKKKRCCKSNKSNKSSDSDENFKSSDSEHSV